MDSLYDIDFLNYLFNLNTSTEDALREFILIRSGCETLDEARNKSGCEIYFKVLDGLYIF